MCGGGAQDTLCKKATPELTHRVPPHTSHHQGAYWLAQSEAASAALLHRSASAATVVSCCGSLRTSRRLKRSRASSLAHSSSTIAASGACSEGTTACSNGRKAATEATSGGADSRSEDKDEGSSALATATGNQPAKRLRCEMQQPPQQDQGRHASVVRQLMHIAAVAAMAKSQQQNEAISGGHSPMEATAGASPQNGSAAGHVCQAAGVSMAPDGWSSQGWVQCDLCQV